MTSLKEAFALSSAEVLAATPPGTSRLIEHSEQENEGDHLRLVPQPSSDPADPLNWANWRKAAVLVVLCFYAGAAQYTSSNIAPALPILAQSHIFDPPIPQSQLGYLTAVNVLVFGIANIFWVPLSNSYGRRPLLLINTLILFLSSIWCLYAKNFGSLLAARAFQAVGCGASDTVVAVMIGEILFVHQAGRGMAIYNFFLTAGGLTGIITGSVIAGNLGFNWIFYIDIIMSALSLAGALLLVPETLYDRRNTGVISPVQETSVVGQDIKETSRHFEDKTHVDTPTSYRPFTFMRSLKIGVYHGNVGRNLLAPWVTLRLPGVWMVMLQFGGVLGALVSMSILGPSTVAGPPYNWGSNAGLFAISGIIGVVIGAFITWLTSDRLLKYMASKNVNGYKEPEMRLPVMIPGLLCPTFGLLVFGFCVQYPGPTRWIGISAGFAMVIVGTVQIPSVGFNYVFEAYPTVAGDGFVVITFFRSVISFAWTFFVGTWVEERGAVEPFGIFALIMGLFSLLLWPMYVYGKRLRIWTAKWNETTIES